ncbi:MAG TPA: CDP-alcohol phosphatidyltransferase family protein [Ktedonobacterales bacterium]|nr:CDP-alcohol phosphatidyltransferase family protein [Ktedonobacterales bacterium]
MSTPGEIREPETGQTNQPPPQARPSLYSESERHFLYPWQRLRQTLLLPLAAGLDALHITPDMLSWCSVVLGAGFFFVARLRFDIAFWLLVGSVFLDGVDGVLARYHRAPSSKGSFTDAFCDEAVVALTVGGLIWKGLINPVLGVIFVYIYTSLVTMLLIHQVLAVSSQGIIRPSRMLLYAFVGIYYFFGWNWMDGLLWVYLLALPILGLSYWRIHRAL